MSIRFIHCADLHLDSPLRGLERYDGAPAQEMREATRRAFVNVVDLAIDREVDFVLIAGDVFDGDWQDFNTGLFFANQLRRLADSSVRVFIVRGNHDALSKISKAVTLPKNTHVFRAGKAPSNGATAGLSASGPGCPVPPAPVPASRRDFRH